MKFYDSVGPNPRIVRMFMAEKGIEMPKQTVDLRKGENREAEHLKRNPHGQMPALELDNGSYLSEVLPICEYLEEKNPAPAMIGTTPEERAECRMWARRVDLNICEHLANGFRFGEGSEVFRKAHPLRARSLARPEDDRGQPPAMARRTDGGQGLSLRQALYDGRHPALLLDRFRRHGRPAAGSKQQQYRGMDGAGCGTAVGEGVEARASFRGAQRERNSYCGFDASHRPE